MMSGKDEAVKLWPQRGRSIGCMWGARGLF